MNRVLFAVALAPLLLTSISCGKLFGDPYGYNGNGLIVDPEQQRNGGSGKGGGTSTPYKPELNAEQKYCPMEESSALKADIARRVSEFQTSYSTTILWETPVEIPKVVAPAIDQSEQGQLWAVRCLVKIMQDEVSTKYPTTLLPFLAQSSINISKSIQSDGDYAGGLASSRGIVWLAIPFLRQVSASSLYTLYADQVVPAMRRTFNHEMLHAMDFKKAFSDTDWKALNPAGFTYKTSTDSGFGSRDEHPTTGFTTGYGTTDSYEDRADTFVYMVLPNYRTKLDQWIQSDTTLRDKAAYLKRQLQMPDFNFSNSVLPTP